MFCLFLSLCVVWVIMINSHVAVDYTDCYKVGLCIPFQKFPRNKPELLQKLTQALKRKYWKSNKHTFFCSSYLEPSCVEIRPGISCHKLCNDAVYHFFQALAPSPSKVTRTVVSEHLCMKSRKCKTAEEK